MGLKRYLPTTKRTYSDSLASNSPSVRPKSKRNKEEEKEEHKILLEDIYALINEMKTDNRNIKSLKRKLKLWTKIYRRN